MSETEMVWFDQEPPADIADALALPIPENARREPPLDLSAFAATLAAIFRPAIESMADALRPLLDDAAGIIDAESTIIEKEETMPTRAPIDFIRLSAELEPRGAPPMTNREPVTNEREDETDEAEYGGWAMLASSMEAPEGAAILPPDAVPGGGLRAPSAEIVATARELPEPWEAEPPLDRYPPLATPPNRHERRARAARRRRGER